MKLVRDFSARCCECTGAGCKKCAGTGLYFGDFRFHPSSFGALMTEPRAKSEILSEACKTKLIELFISEKYKRENDVFNKYMEKGLKVEEDSITLLSRVEKKVYFKNEETLSNNFLVGTPDLFEYQGEQVIHVLDIKSSWDIFTFWKAKTSPINKAYYYQLMAYMELTGARKATLAYCLVDTPEDLINEAKHKLFYRLDAATKENATYIEACEKIEKSMKFDDIPMKERVHKINVHYDEKVVKAMYDRAVECRKELMNMNAVHSERSLEMAVMNLK